MINPFKVLWNDAKDEPLLAIAGLGVLAIGIFMVFVSHGEWMEKQQPLFAEVLRELGIAVCISVFIAIFIEIGLARKTFEKGLDAVMRHTVPDEVWDEIKQHVISQPVLRHGWKVSMKIEPGKTGGYVSTTTVSYDIKSLRDFLTYEVHHEVDGPRVVSGNPFQWIKVEDKPRKLEEIVKGNGAVVPLEFPDEDKPQSVEVCFEEKVQEHDVINWWMNIATHGVTVEIDAPAGWKAEVQAHHPEKKILQPVKGSNSSWACKGVMLPGQGFEIRLSPVSQGQSGQTH